MGIECYRWLIDCCILFANFKIKLENLLIYRHVRFFIPKFLHPFIIWKVKYILICQRRLITDLPKLRDENLDDSNDNIIIIYLTIIDVITLKIE